MDGIYAAAARRQLHVRSHKRALHVPITNRRRNVCGGQPDPCDLSLELCYPFQTHSAMVPGGGRIDLHDTQISAEFHELSGTALLQHSRGRRNERVELYSAGWRRYSLFSPLKAID